jgi:hypothetical protein
MILELGCALGLHFWLGWPVWLSLLTGHIAWSFIDGIARPGLFSVAGHISGLLIEVPIYFILVLGLYLFGHPSW